MPAKLLRHSYSLLVWILGQPVESFGVPAAVLLFCKVSLMDKQNSLSQNGYHHHLPVGARREPAWPFSPEAGNYEGQ